MKTEFKYTSEDDVKKLAKEECKYNHKSIDELSFRLGFEIGYETAQEKGTFTLEDMIKFSEYVEDYYSDIHAPVIPTTELLNNFTKQKY